MTDVYIEALDYSHSSMLKDFEAESINVARDSFNKYLNVSALSDQDSGRAKTFLLIETDENENKTIVGFYSLRASSLIKDTSEYEGEKTGEPALEIYQFAIKRERQKQGFGKMLMQDIIAATKELSQKIGIMYLLVCSVEQAVGFYETCRFRKLPNHATRHIPRNDSNIECIGMYLPIKVRERNK